MAKIKPWVRSPLDVLKHAERLRQTGDDFDRRMAFISYDNANEVSMTTVIKLHPSQRGNLKFSKANREKWLVNYPAKLEFLEHYVTVDLRQRMIVGRDELLYFHRIRNDLYHGAHSQVPSLVELNALRDAALWVFNTLFQISLEEALAIECDEVPSSREL